MERLTIKSPSGLIHLKDNTEMTMNVAIKKLSDFEDLEEQGKLPRLPCAVGDRLYQINADEPSDTDIQSYAIDNIVIREGEILFKHDSWDGVICDLDSLINGSKYLDCLRTFLTYEEAEAALKELEDKKL